MKKGKSVIITSPDNDELLRLIENESEIVKNESIKDNLVKMVVFYIDDKLYAVYGALIQEVVIDFKIFYLPFAPVYIKGLINRHGEPYSVIDIKQLLNNVSINGRTFLVLRNRIDRISFLISSIYKIINISSNEIHSISSVNEGEDFFEGAVSIDGHEVFIINTQKIIEKISNDIK